ncbi:MAG TPA: urease accessory protein UreD [Conexibacter sp.]|jgi:urease accessory protein|nr:urease accessory protein UreD [Conexibacter sp.]
MSVARLSSSHYEVRPLPDTVAAYASIPDTLAAGRPGKVAVLDLAFGPVDGRTELLRRYQKSPLQIMRPLYFDPARPDMAIVLAMSAGAGMVQGDRYRIDAVCEPGSALHLTTQAATKVMRMDADYATSAVNLSAAEDCLLEYLPDPIIPCAGSRSYHRTRVSIARGATAIVGETVRAGRLAHGERHAYDVLATDLEIRRPDGVPLVLDRIRLAPGERPGGLDGPGVLGGEDQLASLHVVSDRAPATGIADALRAALRDAAVRWGVSVLPGDCGAWVRILGSSSPAVDRAMRDAWDGARRLLTGTPAPRLRKSTTFLT